MILARFLLTGCLLAAVAAPALADGHSRCLAPEERRARMAGHGVITLAKAIRALKVPHREVVRASLCENDGRLVYMLTVLGRDGKVTRATIDAANGTVIVGH